MGMNFAKYESYDVVAYVFGERCGCTAVTHESSSSVVSSCCSC